MASMDNCPVDYSLLDHLTALVAQSARQPEQLFVATIALGDEMERLGMGGKDLKKVREAARAVRQMVGCSADTAWNRLSRQEKSRNRKREDAWKQEHTEALLAEGRRRVDEIRNAG